MVKDPLECNMEELKWQLECLGQKKFGKKTELVERVQGCLRLKIPLDPKVDNGLMYQQKLDKINKSKRLQNNVTVIND